jgi:hypothetical protein
MTKYLVITESGADYMIDTTEGFWSHRGYNSDRIQKFQSALDPEYLPWVDEGKEEWHDTLEPIVGERLYLSSLNYWRISTPVVSVEIL